jgi:hypothetical protein
VLDNALLSVAVILVLVVAIWAVRRARREEIADVRDHVQRQGVTIVRLTPAAPNVATLVNEEYGQSRYVSRRVYDVLVDDRGVHQKQVWMVENGRIVRVS